MKKIYSLISTSFLFVAGFSQNVTVPPPNISGTENYVYTREYLEETSTSNSSVPQIQSVTYFDGLGREKQKINIKASSSGKDVVTRMEYDALGRQVMNFLPMPQQNTTNGEIYSSATTPYTEAIGNPLYGGIAPFFSKNEIEYSPLNRPLSTTAPGDWSANNKKVTVEYKFNIAGEVKKYTTVTSWSNGVTSSALNVSGTYSASQLYKTITTDEDSNVSVEYKDKLGQIVLVRKVVSTTENADTYYVYNEYQDLAYVLSPLASVKSTLTATDLDELCYQYRYDDKSRLAEKKLPGKGWEYFVYDNQDRLVMTQDANMGADKLWLFSKYDQFSRVAYAGIYTSSQIYGSLGRNAEQTNVNGKGSNNVEKTSGTTVGFTNSGLGVYYDNDAAKNYPNTITKLLSVNYYDTYPADVPVTNIPTSVQGQAVLSQNSQTSNISTKIHTTASYVKNIEDDNWTKNYIWYDSRGRVIGMNSMNHLGGFTKTESVLDFTGKPKKAFTYHARINPNVITATIEETFTYDPQNRLTIHEHKVNNEPKETLAQNHYNELGQLDLKKVGGTGAAGTELQIVDYKYNIRGWLTDVNDPTNPITMGTDLFAYTVRYNGRLGLVTPNVNYSNLIVQPKYNGNIAEVDWNAVGVTGYTPYDSPLRYGYVYDKLNRLQAGFYQDPSNPSKGTNNEIIEEYDLNGNIKKLKRFAYKPKSSTPAKIDDLTYNYSGNKVTNIADAANNASGYEGGNVLIEYDLNGNMTKMPDKGITNIVYNYLNLPKEIVQVNNSKYFYRADGVKIKKTFTLNNADGSNTANTEYLDGFQYITESSMVAEAFKQNDDNTISAKTASEEETFVIPEDNIAPVNPTTMRLSFFPTAEGFYDFKNKQYVYQYKDHLGNVRLSYAKNAITNTLDILDQNDYYPFGMNFNGYYSVFDAMGSLVNYKYNGKELQETGMYDYGARMYMPDVARWFTIDPLAEKSRRWNPYAYAFNNPIRFIDPDGREGESSGGDGGGGSGGGGETGSGGNGDNPYQSVEIMGVKMSVATMAVNVQFSASYGSPSSQAADSQQSSSSNSNTDKNNDSKEGATQGENKDQKPTDSKDKEPDHKDTGGKDGQSQQQQKEEPYVQNNTKGTVYFKTEHGADKIPIKAGEKTTRTIDGIRVGNTVVKVTDGYTKVVVNSNGTVDVYYPNIVYGAIYEVKGGGVLSSPPDEGWFPIFNVVTKDTIWTP